MTTFEGKVSTISDTGADDQVIGYIVDRQDMFRAAVGRPIDIYLPTANGLVRGLARIQSVDGTEATVEFTVDELAPAQLGDLFGDDWQKPTMRMFGAAVQDVVVRGVSLGSAGISSAANNADTQSSGHE